MDQRVLLALEIVRLGKVYVSEELYSLAVSVIKRELDITTVGGK